MKLARIKNNSGKAAGIAKQKCKGSFWGFRLVVN